VTGLAPEDRCHLNGIAMVDGRPKYVTALGQTDTPGGWRANKANGGVLMDVESNEILLRGLSMPHSPRWYREKLWVLESGEGSLAAVDLERRTWQIVAQVPGFTRGIDFIGPLAFIGLSQVRESAVFSGIPLVQRLKERTCGVWVVNIETGQTLGFLRFESGVQEIFAVQILRGIRFPELLEWSDPRLAHSYVLPDEALRDVIVPTEKELERSPAFHFQRGNDLYKKGQLDEAIAAYRQCVALQPEFPNARYHLGVALADTEHYEEAGAYLEQVVQTEPEKAEAHNSLGYVASRQRQLHKAVNHWQRAIELQPNYAPAHVNLGMGLLQLGDYARGFAEFEWRPLNGFRSPHPKWDGHPIPDKTLLIYTEQSAGEAIQFARYLPLAAECCNTLILACPADLMPIFATIPGIAQIREQEGIRVSEFDTYLPLMSLPHVFGTTLDTIPATVPYVHAAALRRRKDNPSLSLKNSEYPKVGIAWAGSAINRTDRYRSCPLNEFLPILTIPDVSFYSLEKGERHKDLADIPSSISVQNLELQLRDLGDLAVIIDQLDLVISVDTAVAHIAGALGKPVWALLSYIPDWRWMLEGEATPWYPTMRLFRQVQPGDWSSVIERVAETLRREEWGESEYSPQRRRDRGENPKQLMEMV
jgi:tetratricopeptide (TPR) repeat protein